jgi:hypothetical protein
LRRVGFANTDIAAAIKNSKKIADAAALGIKREVAVILILRECPAYCACLICPLEAGR